MSDITLGWPGSNMEHNGKDRAPDPATVIVTPDEGKLLRAFGEEVRVHLSGTETGGQLTVFSNFTPPGGGPPPHYHVDEDEWFIPQQGHAEFFLDGQWQAVEPGTIIYVPRGTIHTFRNAGETPLITLIQTSPSGFETFFERCAAEFAKEGPPDMERIVAIAAEHGIHFVDN